MDPFLVPPPPPPSPQSEVPWIGQIKRIGNVVSVTALVQNHFQRTADGSQFTSTSDFRKFGWREFQLQNGADTALQCLPAGIRDRIETILKSDATTLDVKSGEEILFGKEGESALGTTAFSSAFSSSSSAFGATVGLEIPVQGISNTWGTQWQRIFSLVFLVFLVCVGLLIQGRSWLF